MSRPFYIDPMDGRLVPLRAVLLGEQALQLGEQTFGARRYLVAGESPWILWFGPDRLLVKMQLLTEDGSMLELRLTTRTEGSRMPGLAATFAP